MLLLCLVTSLAVLSPRPAAADESKTVAATVPDSGGNAASSGETATATAAATAEQAEAPRYPRAVIARPLTLPQGLAMLGADATANHDFSAMGGAPILGYGFTDDFEVQIPYTFATKDFELKGSLNVDLGYKLLRGAVDGKLEAIARVRGGYNLLTETANPLLLGVHVQYNVTDTLAIISGTPGSQQLRISLDDGGTMTTPADLSLPLSIGYQATGEVYLQLDTKLFQIDLHDSANAFIGADTTPMALTVVYNVLPALDVQAAVATDLSNAPGDNLSLLVGARYYAGKL
ncbi:MAG TPA: hypothetical protein VLM79_31145 [Kofleriaceae bacterium]|nr:hypothetical protein [Kofleriaceae bacterium]